MSAVPVIDVSRDDVAELRRRLRHTRWADTWPIGEWEAGTKVRDLRDLVSYWSEDFDWAAQQERINALPWHEADIGGVAVAYLRFDAETAGGLPIVLTNGWPSTALELIPLAERLSMPSRFGGDPVKAVTVIVPAIPGLPFSPPRPALGQETHELWHQLMTDDLDFARYAAHEEISAQGSPPVSVRPIRMRLPASTFWPSLNHADTTKRH